MPRYFFTLSLVLAVVALTPSRTAGNFMHAFRVARFFFT
jgi:hypothetical protein